MIKYKEEKEKKRRARVEAQERHLVQVQKAAEREHFRKRECERLLREGERVSSSLENIQVVVKAMFPIKKGDYKVSTTGKRKRGNKSELNKQISKRAREMHFEFQMRSGGEYETMQYPPVLYTDERSRNDQLGHFLAKTKKKSLTKI